MRFKFPKQRYLRNNGFSLLEIMVVLIIIAVAGSMVFINVGRSAKNDKGKKFAESFILMLKHARRGAISMGEPFAMNISSERRICYLDGEERPISIPEEVRIEGEGLSQRIVNEGDPEGEEEVHAVFFYPDGSSGGGEITISFLEEEIGTIRIDMLTGFIKKVESEN